MCFKGVNLNDDTTEITRSETAIYSSWPCADLNWLMSQPAAEADVVDGAARQPRRIKR